VDIPFITIGIFWMYVWLKELLGNFIGVQKYGASGINFTRRMPRTLLTSPRAHFEIELQEADLRLKYGIPEMMASHHD